MYSRRTSAFDRNRFCRRINDQSWLLKYETTHGDHTLTKTATGKWRHLRVARSSV
jgi:hypothetical protein